jgi:sugar phosphate isomerase/epimerase
LESTLERFLWSLERLADLGFRNFGLEILEPEHTCLYREPDAVARLLAKSAGTGVRLNHFTIWHCCSNLVSAEPERRKLGVAQFEEGVRIAQDLSIPLVTIGSDWPPEWVSHYREEYQHAPAEEFFVPSPGDYDRLWQAHVEAILECVAIAEKASVRFGLEPRANSLVASSDAFLRLWDQSRSERFGCVLDVTHAAFHRENLPAAIKKLGPRLFTLQVCGTDGVSVRHLPLGESDRATLAGASEALRDSGFNGTVDVEMYGMPVEQVDESYRQARAALEQM